jgi:phytoene dehydrogenase-like protein
MKRAVVIGSGHNGLIAAIRLASHGVEVTVLEHAPRPGGATASSELTLPGFVHDHCAAFVPMAAASPVIRELRLEQQGVRWIDPEHILAHPFEDGSAIVLDRSVEATVASLGSAGRGWETAMKQMLPLAEPLVQSVLSPLPPMRPAARLAFGLRGELPQWTRKLLGSVETLGLDLFEGDRRATAWLAGSAQHSGLPPSTTVSGAFGFLLQLMGHSHGWPLPEGGMGRLVDALLGRAEQEGAGIRCSAPVRRILVRSGRATGVELQDGERIDADMVLSTVSAGVLASLLADGDLPRGVERQLRRWRYGTGAFKLDYALSAAVPWVAEEARRAAVVHVGGALSELTAAAQAGARGELPTRPALVVGQQSLHDSTRAPAGSHTLYVYAHVPPSYSESDEHVAGLIEDQIERFAPGFRDNVLARRIRAPGPTERQNPSLVGGDIGGGSYELDQQLVFRPTPRLSRYGTPISGLFVAGASTHPGGAVHGVSGQGAARAALREARLVPWRGLRS